MLKKIINKYHATKQNWQEEELIMKLKEYKQTKDCELLVMRIQTIKYIKNNQ